MTTAVHISEAISSTLDVPQSTTNTVVRRLGEANAIPRGTRGRSAALLNFDHAAKIIVGVMTTGDGFGGTSTRVAQAVRSIGRHKSLGTVKASFTDSFEDSDNSISVVVPGPFTSQIANLISLCADPTKANWAKRFVDGVGLIFDSNRIVGWLETTGTGELLYDGIPNTEGKPRPQGGVRILFSRAAAEQRGLIREVRLEIDTISEIAQKIKATNQRGFMK